MATKTADKPEPKTQSKPRVGPPPKPEGKEERRQYQRGPESWAWLTKQEARDEGFFWNDNPNV